MTKAETYINSESPALNKSSKNYNCMDLMKFISSLLVIVIHTNPLLQFSDAANYMFSSSICRLAVPFFFMSTGFLVFRKIDFCNMQRGSLVAFTKKILRLYFIWSVIYFPFSIFELYKTDKNILSCLIKYLRNIVFWGSFSSLWYMPAVIVAVWLTYFSIKHFKKFKIIIPCAIFLYIAGMYLLTYRKAFEFIFSVPEIHRLLSIAEKIFMTTRNGLFFGFIFVAIGAFFAYKPIKINLKKAVALFLISTALLFAEVMLSFFYFRAELPDMWFMLLPSSFFLFYIVTHIELKNSGKYIFMRKMSSLIYFGHFLIIIFFIPLLNKIFQYLLHSDFSIEELSCYIITSIASVIISYVIIKLSQKPRLKFLKKLYA